METQDRGNTEGRRTDHVALDGQAVAVAHRELQHRLDTVGGQDRCTGQGGHVGPGPGAVGDVDGIDEALETASPLQHRFRGGGIGWRGLRSDDEIACGEARFELSP